MVVISTKRDRTEKDKRSKRNFNGSFKEALLPLIFLSSIFYLSFVSRVVGSPLLPVIEEELGISHAQGGSLFFCVAFGYIAMILGSPFICSKIGNQRTIALSGILSGVSLILFSFSYSLLTFQIMSCCLGFSAGFYLPAAMVTIAELTPPSHLARGMAVHEIAPNLAFVSAPLIATFFLSLTNWRYGVQGFGFMMIIWSFFYLLYGCNARRIQPPISIRVVRHFFSNPLFWRVTIMLCFAASSTMGIYSMLPLLLVNVHNFSSEQANSLVALSRVASIIMPFVGGWLGDRFGNGRVIVGVLLLAGCTTLPMGFFSEGLLLFFIFIQPLIAVAFFPSCFALYACLGSNEFRGMGVTLGTPIGFFIGAGCLPMVIGSVGDFFGLDKGFIVAGFFMIVTALFVGCNKKLLVRDNL